LESGIPILQSDLSGSHELSSDQRNLLAIVSKDKVIYKANVTLSEDCFFKSARAILVQKELQDCGEVIFTLPSQAELEQEHFENSFEIYFTSAKDESTLKNRLEIINEVDNVSVEKYVSEFNLAKSAEPEKVRDRHLEVNRSIKVDIENLQNVTDGLNALVAEKMKLESKFRELALLKSDIEILTELNNCIDALQNSIYRMRLVSLDQALHRLPRVVRDLSQALGKDVKLDLEGLDVKIDRDLIEGIKDPVLHIVRNAIDHGVETPEVRESKGKDGQGRIQISCKSENGFVVVQMVDDGQGINLDRVREKALEAGIVNQDQLSQMNPDDITQLIFHSGLSTAKEVSEISGRGVGMDIVYSNIKQLGGHISISTVSHKGTTVKLFLPSNLNILRGFLVCVNHHPFVIPLNHVVEILQYSHLKVDGNCPLDLIYENQSIPLVYLEPKNEIRNSSLIFIIRAAEKIYGLCVDSSYGVENFVVQQLNVRFSSLPIYQGATVLEDGNIALILDCFSLSESMLKIAV
jgi:two-component system chemotaxis sensor kinase CheA